MTAVVIDGATIAEELRARVDEELHVLRLSEVRPGLGTVLAGDLGCLLQIAGGLKRERANVEARHVAEVLADMTDAPAIAAPREPR